MLNPLTKLHTPACPKRQASYTVRKGKRRNRLQILQLYQCAECLYRFTGAPGRNKTYPLKHILEAISTYNLSATLFLKPSAYSAAGPIWTYRRAPRAHGLRLIDP